MKRPHKLLASIAICSLLLTGCGTKWGYNMADWWVGWTLKGYVSLDREQRGELKQHIKTLHSWHRQTQLPVYADFLEQLKTMPDHPQLTGQVVEDKAVELQKLLQQTAAEAVTPFTTMLLSLNEEQVEELLATLDEKIAEERDEHVKRDADEQREYRIEFMTDLIKSWAGRPTEAQRERITQWATEIESAMAMEMDSRQYWRNQLAEQLPLRTTQPEKIEQLVRDILLAPPPYLSESEKERMARNQQLSYQLVADLMQSLSDKQRQHFNEEIDDLTEDLRELVKQ